MVLKDKKGKKRKEKLKMKKLFGCFFLLMVIAFVSVGCGEKNEIDSDFIVMSPEELKAVEGTIEFDFRVPSGIIAQPTKDLVKGFEKEWDNKIKVNVIVESGGYDGVRSTTILDINSKIAPTMVLGYPDHFAEYYESGYLLNLSEFIKQDKEFSEEDYIESYLDENRIAVDSDDLYGLPYNKSTEVLVYNKTVFDAMKYEVPETWEDVEKLSKQILADCEAGKLDDIVELSEGVKKPSEQLKKGLFYPFSYDSTDNAFITMCRQFGGAYTERESVAKGYAVFNNEQVKTGLKYFQDLSKQKYFAVAESFGLGYSSDAFKAMQCILTVGSSAGVSYNIPTGDLFEIGVSFIPYTDADHKYVIQQGTNMCILGQNTNEQRSAAWQLCKYLTRTEITAQFAISSGSYLPVRKSAYELDDYKSYLNGDMIDKVDSAKAAKVGLEYLNEGWKMFTDEPFYGSAEVRETVGSAFVNVVVNKKDVDQMIKQALNELGPSYQK